MLTEALLLVFLLLIIYSCFPSKPERLPPGIWGWPLVGALPKAGIPLVQQVSRLREKHGNVISWRIGSRINIFLCSYKVIKEVFSKAETSDRPDLYSLEAVRRFRDEGMIASSGLVWHRNRRFTLRHLKDLGLGKSVLEENIQYEAEDMIKILRKQVGSPKPIPWSINVAVINVIWQIVAGRRYDTDNPRIIELHKTTLEIFRNFEGSIQYLDHFPWLVSVLPYFVKTWLGMTGVHGGYKRLHDSFKDIIDEHVAKLDRNNPKDFIDDYLIEMENEESDSNDHMSLGNLEVLMADFFIAGSDTVSNTIRWALIFLAKYPDVQRKIQREIDAVVPRDRLPSLLDKKSLPYTEAVTFEVLRITTISGIGVAHLASEDIEVNGYVIPKGSVMHGYLTLCDLDPEHWTNPEEFSPERFLDDKGEFLKPKEGFAPFSVGRRSCIGENLSKMEFFLFLTALMQKLSVSAPKGQELYTGRDPKERFLNLPGVDVELIIEERN